MTTYEVRFTHSAQKELKKLSKDGQVRVLKAVKTLSQDPTKGDVRPMVGSTAWRLRVGQYRVIYDINKKEIVVLVLKIGHRKDVYR